VAFSDRTAAGIELAGALRHLAGTADLLVLGLPRGGVPVAAEVARALGAPLDVFVVAKIGLPGQVELAVGALASGGARVLNEPVIRAAHISAAALDGLVAATAAKLDSLERRYRGARLAPVVAGRPVILVDDGLATGSTMRVAIEALRALGAARLVVAVPVAPVATARALAGLVDELVCLVLPEPFVADGAW
jgi:predicted phosphoribosyltransferase